MGTRADFYVGRGKDAEWLGSIAWDGYPNGIPENIRNAKRVNTYRKRVKEFLESRDDGTLPDMGWPWPWVDSNTTDFAYAFEKGEFYGSSFGDKWFDARPGIFDDEEYTYEEKTKQDFPNMKEIQNINFGERSGLLFITAPKEAKAKSK